MLLTFNNLGMSFSAQLQASCDPKHEWLPKITIVEHFNQKDWLFSDFLNTENQPIRQFFTYSNILSQVMLLVNTRWKPNLSLAQPRVLYVYST